MKNQVRFQQALWRGCSAAGLESKAEQTRDGSFVEEERSHTLSTWYLPWRRVLQVLHPDPAQQMLHPLPVQGADGAPGGVFPMGWICSSHTQPLQTQATLSPAGAEHSGFVYLGGTHLLPEYYISTKTMCGSVFRSLLPVYII